MADAFSLAAINLRFRQHRADGFGDLFRHGAVAVAVEMDIVQPPVEVDDILLAVAKDSLD